ncbi:MAG TPA: hypothetical protein PKU85_02490 [Bacteroidales bacterium]|nr:MAG: hypothetical protein BWX62_00772 [Bacteroidetes bacterium ADurb.Bin037]HPV88064.1 hypothetical protein [Bacteroidales bacterium]HPW78336.1 hypothetical protein [Bacteroidales bacterium]HQB56311.1 hypothetical protein [Bacteroidales bacterium]
MYRLIIKRLFAAWFVFIVFGAQAQQVPVITPGRDVYAFESTLDRDSILIGDQVWWKMNVPREAWQDKQIETVQFPSLPFDISQGVEALSPVLLDSVFRKKRLEAVEARILLTSFDSGSYQLPPMPLYLKQLDGVVDTLWFKGPELYVNTIQVDTTSFEPFGIKDQMGYPPTVGEILSLVGLIVLIVGLILLIVRIVKRRRKNLPVFGPIRPKDPPHVVALKVLESIRKQELWKKLKAKQYYTLLTDTMRIYLRDRWGIQAMEQTSAEMICSLKKEEAGDSLLTDKNIGLLEDMFRTGDLAKFAKYVPSDSENRESLEQAIRFVAETAVHQADKNEDDKEE